MNKRLFVVGLVLGSLVWTGIGASVAGAESARVPLLQEGKKTLYQRVVTHPGAAVRQRADASAPAVQAGLRPFTVLYVYDRRPGWLEVGSLDGPQGWLADAQATAWNQSLTLLFTPRSGREPVLFFKDRESLHDLCAAADMERRLADLHRSIDATRAGSGGGDPSVVAAEPSDAQGAVAAQRFYLMPILDMADPFEGVKFLKVASIDPGSDPEGKDPAADTPRTGIAFVIDTSISMKPYIDQSLNVIRSIYDQLEKDKLSQDMGFAVVAFRSSTRATPGLEYTSRVISDFTTARDRAALESELAKVQEAGASSHAFDEDSPSGIKTALDDLDWGPYSTRMLMVISDAGPLPATDPYAEVRMAMPELADYARAKGVWISAVHIKSPAGRKNHASAEQAYRELTRLSDNRSNYQAVPAPTPAEGAKQFGLVAKALTSGVVNMVRQTLDGKLVTKPSSEAVPAPTPEAEAQRTAAALGYAMQLEYLGRARENRAPSVVEAWIADMDLGRMAASQQTPTVEVAVLLTKNQLSDLSQQLKIIIDNAERTKKTDSRDFFEGILSASARMARDPGAVSQGRNLAELGVLTEFLDGLPYKSDIMLLSEEDWYRMSVGEQTAFINRLKSRLARYEAYDKDRAHWESFGSSNPGDWMYRVPLTMLP